MRSLRLLLTFVTAVSLVACGGSSPTEPTSPAVTPTAPTATAGATIAGQVSSGATAGASASGIASSRATPVSTISVVGTSLTTSADATGRFTFTGVPAGAAQLHFTGPGTDATLPIGEVRTGDTVTLMIAVNGTAATVLSDSRTPSGAANADQRRGPQPHRIRVDQFEFTIDGQRIRGDRVTEFYGHPNMTPARVFEEMNNTAPR